MIHFQKCAAPISNRPGNSFPSNLPESVVAQHAVRETALRNLLHLFLLITTATVFVTISCPAFAAEVKENDVLSRTRTEMEAAVRLQIFLDRAEFAPGKIDGHYGEFTVKALELFRESRGEKTPPPAEKPDASPDVSGLDLASVEPLFLSYTVTETDMQNLGAVPDAVPEQAQLKELPYKTAAESVAEKFHTDLDFLEELNPGKTKEIKAGDTLSVPNVEPFELSTVKGLKPESELAVTELEEHPKDEPAATKTAVKIDTKNSMLTVHEDGKLIAAFPVTIGSVQTESPVGDWKVRGVAMMPDFRHDKAMLKKGERSDKFHILPPGPNNPVGVVWIALNKKGIGLHGTNDPDSIGRSASHGCVRMANWDVIRLAWKIKAGVPVSIH